MTARSVRYAVCEAMGSAIPEGFRPDAASRPMSAARADVPEGVAVDGVAADPAVSDTDAAPSYRDRVKHDVQSVRLSPSPTTAVSSYRLSAEAKGAFSQYRESERERVKYAEHVRRARLSRWQETRG